MTRDQLINRRTVLRGFALGSAGLAGAALVGCGSDDDAPPTGERQRLTISGPFEPAGYVDGDVQSLAEGIGEGLVRVDFDGALSEGLATDWEHVDPVTWRFTVRDGVPFHDGTMFDVEAAAFALQRLSTLETAPGPVAGATVEVTGDQSLTVTTVEPVAAFPAIMASSHAVIFSRSTYEAGADGALPLGTGSFRARAFRPGDRRELDAFDDYWGGRPGVSGVDFLMVTAAQTRMNQIRAGEIDVALIMGPSETLVLEGVSGVEVLRAPLPRFRALYPNLRGGATSDVRVRRAIAHAVERQVMVDTVLEGQGAPQEGLFRSDFPWGNPDLRAPQHDLVEARALLEAAGYGDGNPLPLSLHTYPSRAELPDLAQVIQQQLGEAGIQVQLQVRDYNPIETERFAGEIDLVLLARNPLFFHDPQSFFESDYTSTGAYNLAHYGEQDERIRASASLLDADERYAQYREIERQIIEEDVGIIVLSSYIQVDALRPGVSGYRAHPLELQVLSEALAKA